MVEVPGEVYDEISNLYPVSRVPLFLESYNTEDWDAAFRVAFLAAVNNMKSDSTPGAFYSNLYRENKQVFELALDALESETKDLVERCLTGDLERSDGSPLFLRTGQAFKVFVKGELHSLEKVKEGRHRLIFASPLPLTLADRMFFGGQNDVEIENWKSCPSKVGMTVNEEGALSLEQSVKKIPNPISTDMSGWDWSVQSWMLDGDIEIRYRLLVGDLKHKTRWHIGARGLNNLLKWKTLMFSDGTLWSQMVPGIMASGSYRTSSSNSKMRVLARKMATGNCNIITYGDDAVEAFEEDLVAKYHELGLKLKSDFEHVESGHFEFCNKWWTKGSVVPTETSTGKMVCGLILHPTEEARESIRMELINSPFLPFLQEIGLLPY
jgi:hypothetical protein